MNVSSKGFCVSMSQLFFCDFKYVNYAIMFKLVAVRRFP